MTRSEHSGSGFEARPESNTRCQQFQHRQRNSDASRRRPTAAAREKRTTRNINTDADGRIKTTATVEKGLLLVTGDWTAEVVTPEPRSAVSSAAAVRRRIPAASATQHSVGEEPIMEFCQGIWHLFILSMFAVSVISNNMPSFRTHAGVYWLEKKGVITYEESIPLLYKIPFSPSSDSKVIEEWENKTCSMTQKHLCSNAQVLKTFAQRLENSFKTDNRFEFLDPTSRERRGIQFLGDIGTWCCNILTEKHLHSLLMNDKVLNENFKNIYSDVATTNTRINEVTSQLLQMADQTKHIVHYLSDTINNVTTTLNNHNVVLNEVNTLTEIGQLSMSYFLHFMHNILREQEIHNIHSHCKAQHLPISLIKPVQLKSDLKKLHKALNLMNMTLSLTSQDVLHYYSLPITECTMSDKQIIIRLHVPVIHANTQWKLFELIPIPFSYMNVSCYLHTNKMLVALDINTQNLKIIPSSSEHDHNIYKIPKEVTTTPIARCIQAGITLSNYSQLMTVCKFSCYEKTSVVITHISPHFYIISNHETDLTIQCHNASLNRVIKNTEIGSTELQLPCGCEVKELNNVLITPTYLCDINSPNQTFYQNVIPIQWIDDALYAVDQLTLSTGIHFSNITHVLNPQWHLKYLSNVSNQHLHTLTPLPTEETSQVLAIFNTSTYSISITSIITFLVCSNIFMYIRIIQISAIIREESRR
ncbi:uncharacterized protein LOC134537928 [Bacillus rossius redtenbacheri]|uniref:uncharacterized protein LOC134537928 n=1 Tax=Bacillus rossius redtenbacheri TaxID=93214 RepID=UPI002FDE3065